MPIDQKLAFVKTCPRKVFKYDSLRQAVDIEDLSKCNLCNECNKYTIENDMPGTVRLDER